MKHKEIIFETEIVQYLTSHDWLEGQSASYDKALALYPEDVVNFIKNAQPEAYEKYAKRYVTDTDKHLVNEVAKNLNKQGALFYLRNEMNFICGKLRLCQFQPDLPTPALLEKYNQNILRVVRQVYYSEKNQNSIDPVHFAVSADEVYMATSLAGKSNSIAWLSHQLSSLHDEQQQQVFDTVIVLTDRTVLDSQLQETITQFEHKSGVVVTINNKEGEGSNLQS